MFPLAFLFLLVATLSPAAALTVSLTPDPGRTPVYAHDLVEFIVRTDKNDPVRIRLLAPAKKWFVSTDYPLVEGSTLLEWETVPDKQEVSFSYRLPIRGEYRFTVESPTGKFPAVSQTFEIQEQPRKRRNLLIAMTGLFLLGGLCGYRFAG